MDISFKNALKAPLEKRFFIMALIPFIITLGAYITGFNYTNPHVAINGVFYFNFVLYFTGSLLMAGYTLLFMHNVLDNKRPFIPSLSFELVKGGIKMIAFFLCWLVLCWLFLIPVSILILNTPLLLGMILFYITFGFALLYSMAAFGHFVDTLSLKTFFQIKENFIIMKKNAWNFCRILFFNVGAALLVMIPLYLIKHLILIPIVFVFPVTYVLIVYVLSLIILYAPFVGAHIFAQGYAGIKADQTPLRSRAPLSNNAPKTILKSTPKTNHSSNQLIISRKKK